MTHLAPDACGRRRRFRAWIFTAVLSRYRFVYPVFRETTETAIEACEAAWAFFQGVFRVLIPDNTKAIVQRADPLEPLLNPTFLEYAQARGFVIDPTRVRRARDKAYASYCTSLAGCGADLLRRAQAESPFHL
jgi:transposase